MDNKLYIKLRNGSDDFGFTAESFNPTAERLELASAKTKGRVPIALEEVCYIKFLGKPDVGDTDDEIQFFEDITTIHGETFHIRQSIGEKFSRGFFAYPIDEHADFTKIFFNYRGIRTNGQEQPIGAVLQQKGMIDQDDLENALQDQENLRTRLVGEIISEKTKIPQAKVDQTIHRSHRLNRQGQIKVGDILIEAGLVTQKQVEDALADQSNGKRKRIGTILLERGLISEDQLLTALAQKFNLRLVDLDSVTPTQDALSKLPPETIERMQVLPVELRGRCLVIATSTPTDPTISENLRFVTNTEIELVVAGAGQIRQKIETLFGGKETSLDGLIDEFTEEVDVVHEESEAERVTESDSKVINLVNKVLINAYRGDVSDIHFEPGLGPQPMRIRYRKDGICYTMHQISGNYKAAIISRVKIIAKLDIAERRRPQTGKIMLKHGRERIEYRVEIMPTIGGQEDAVLRVLTSSQVLPLEQVGFSESNLKKFRQLTQKPHGIVLCAGPTGSGKTTSLHSALANINDSEKKIWTAEDPVEIVQDGLRQVQVHPKIGFTFDVALRSFLRSDPDVIMIGEMRDSTTAKTAIEASLTGHLVFSTLHTNNAPETVVRLIEMGVDPYNFADALLGILAQRLIRTLCNKCKQPYNPTLAEYEELVDIYGSKKFNENELPEYSNKLVLMRATGCPACDESGYRGRMAVHELLCNSQAIRKAIKLNLGVDELRKIAIAEGMATLRQDGIQKIFLGLTDLKQVNRVTT
ncbi:MAG: type II secretion system protein E [Desulfuromonas sp.]|nr:MAG: type II secretion system protein E [Desulfuromonas sp.]